MKIKLISILLVFFNITLVYSQNDSFREIYELVEKRQYLTAINRLNSQKAENNKPELIDLKVQITIEGFVQSINHRMFAFKNLEPNENVLDLRRNGGNFSMIMGDLKEEIDEYINRYPDSYYVFKAAGDYYVDVLLRYGDQLEDFSYSDLYQLIVANYETAYSLGCDELEVIAGVGEYSLRIGDFEKTAKFYNLALVQEPRNASFNYNISIAYQNLQEFEKALQYSEIAIEEYNNDAYIADSYHINGYQNRMLNRNNKAIDRYRKALKLNPDLYYSQTGLIDLLLSENRLDEAEENFNYYFIRNINDFAKLQEFIRIYFNHNRIERVTNQLKQLISLSNNNIHKGTLYYHLGIINNSTKQNPEQNLIKAKEFYLKEMNDQEEIIKHIDSFLSEIGT